MAVNPTSSSCLELTISVPGSSSSPSLPPSVGNTMRDFDINKVPYGEGDQEEWMMANMEDDDDNNEGHPRKKLRLTKEQSLLLEESFRQNHTLNPKQKESLAEQLKLRPRQVEVWFQNRRARSKLKQTEMECAYLRRWFGSLTEQNRRLQKEVEELRALKVGPPTVISQDGSQAFLASTLTMCPRCERITTTSTTVHDKGPIRDTNNNTTSDNAAELSPKGVMPFLQSRQSSAAC